MGDTDGVLRYVEPMRRFRFLLSDGRVVDVEACRDDSHLRDWVRQQCGGRLDAKDGLAIMGVADLPDQEPLS